VVENNNNLRFVPFKDLMGSGTSKGFFIILVPGSSIVYLGTNENNSFYNQEAEKSL
jgi:hypothetical protein